ncbi:MAG: DUF1704 domain-containing protein [Acidimicrobiia bacterium]|nr:DUF1704 domain-containing protein [Acidimicrobiia bacterium]
MAKAEARRLDDRLAEFIIERLEADKPIRTLLPPDGRVNIDRQLPFLFVYRPPPGGLDPVMTSIMAGGASYLVTPSPTRTRAWSGRLIKQIAETLSNAFGRFLIIELWPGEDAPVNERNQALIAEPSFKLLFAKGEEGTVTAGKLSATLGRILVLKKRATIETAAGQRPSPPGLPRVLTNTELAALKTSLLGIEIRPIYREPETKVELPLVGRSLARQISRSLQRTVFEFASAETTERSMHYHALGRRTFVAAVKRVDTQLTAIAESFDLLLTVTPANAESAYRTFRRSKFQRTPRFQYRPSTVDPDLVKRQLWNAPIERIEDFVLDQLFREKQRELDLKLTLIAERERHRFLPTSMALYGPIDAELQETATTLLAELPVTEGSRRERSVTATEFVARAEDEFSRLRSDRAPMGGQVVVRDDVASLMVSSGNLIVGSEMSFPARRVEPLIQHEVGTHALTYWNGRAQPFQLLATGLAGHDELQEGLAVFVEYLVGGLTIGRLRTLAARVLAASSVIGGASFIDTFMLLHDTHGFTPRTAFMTTMRVHRGGGLTKDAVYLRGLARVMEYLGKGGRLDTLFVGKIATHHVSVIEELQRRHVLEPPPFRPSYLDEPDAHYRIERIRAGIEIHDLVDV